MESGSPLSIGDITNGQDVYDAIVNSTGCSSSNDTLQCLRGVSLDALQQAVNQSPSFFTSKTVCTSLYNDLIMRILLLCAGTQPTVAT